MLSWSQLTPLLLLHCYRVVCCRAAYDYLVAKADITQLIQCGPACLLVALHIGAKNLCVIVHRA